MERGNMVRALIVEDNRRYLEAFKAKLHEHAPALIIEEAGSGEEALERIREAPPQLIFMDIRLPGMNGLQVTQKVKKDFPQIRIAVLTSYDLPEYQQAAMQYGADRFFVKDLLNWDEVEALVKSIDEGAP